MKLYKLNIYNYLLTKHDETKMDLWFLKQNQFFGEKKKLKFKTDITLIERSESGHFKDVYEVDGLTTMLVE